ncbi:hypothetical protein C8J57DRAFT_1227677 [Mycena rebaudengoi]|nr:hypothetical protein C8J57DRAFT_1227677 [Mycena rebaudengoi]
MSAMGVRAWRAKRPLIIVPSAGARRSAAFVWVRVTRTSWAELQQAEESSGPSRDPLAMKGFWVWAGDDIKSDPSPSKSDGVLTAASASRRKMEKYSNTFIYAYGKSSI